MKRTIQATIISALLMSAYAQATPMSLSPDDSVWDGADCGSDCGPGMSHILTWLDANVAGFDSSNELYKSDEDGDAFGDDSGEFASDYTTEFMNMIGDPSGATISLALGGGIQTAAWLLVKDGTNVPVWYLFDLSDWDGMMDIVLTGFWLGNGAISNVSIVGVPEPGTLALLAIGLAGAAFSRRKKAA